MPIAALYTPKKSRLPKVFGLGQYDDGGYDPIGYGGTVDGGGAYFYDNSGGYYDSSGGYTDMWGDYYAPGASDMILANPPVETSTDLFALTPSEIPAELTPPAPIDTSYLNDQQLLVLEQATLLNVDPALLALQNDPVTQGLTAPQIAAIQQAMQPQKAVGPIVAKPPSQPAGAGFQTSPTPKPAATTTPTTPTQTPAQTAAQQQAAAQTAATIAALQQQLAQAKAAGNTTAAAQLQAQIAALGGGTSWFTQQSIISGVPNWAILAGGGVVAFLLMGTGARYTTQSPVVRRRNPHRRHRRS